MTTISVPIPLQVIYQHAMSCLFDLLKPEAVGWAGKRAPEKQEATEDESRRQGGCCPTLLTTQV